MLRGIIGFEIRYQLRNPVFWVSIAIFLLLGFGLTASENVSIGTPGAVKENSPFAITIATGVLTIFYLLVITAFVANAIVLAEFEDPKFSTRVASVIFDVPIERRTQMLAIRTRGPLSAESMEARRQSQR